MVLTADFHAAEGRVRRRLVTLGEGGGSRSSAHPEAVSTASTSASAPSPPPPPPTTPTLLEKGWAFLSSAAPCTRLDRPVTPAILSPSSRPRLKLAPVVVAQVFFFFVVDTTSHINDSCTRDYHIARECALTRAP